MIKKNKWALLISSLLILLPMAAGGILWNRLPEQIPVHFNALNEPDGWGNRAFVVFGMPLLMLVLHWFCVAVTAADPKRKNIGEKPMKLVFWIIPVMTLMVFFSIYGVALGYSIRVGMVCCMTIGVLFVILGNLQPKTKLNYTFGIKLPWTLNDEENWKHTHRVAGWTMAAAGVIILATAFLEQPWILFTAAAAAVVIPIAYSFWYDRSHR